MCLILVFLIEKWPFNSSNRNDKRLSNDPTNLRSKAYLFEYLAQEKSSAKDRHFQFQIKQIGLNYRIYIQKYPMHINLGYILSSIPHVLYDFNKRFICWDSEVKTAEDAEKIAKEWANRVQIHSVF